MVRVPSAPAATSSAELYRLMLGSRLAEQRITELSKVGKIPGHHSGLNYEAIGVGIGTAVEDRDCVQTSYRWVHPRQPASHDEFRGAGV